MKEVFVIKGRKVKVEGLGDRESKREFAEKFIKYKEDVERFLGFDEEKALSEVRTKGIDPESHYTIRIIFSPYFPLAKFYWDTEEFAFIFNLFQSSRIHEDIFYHEISHYFLTLNCIRLIDKHVKENLSSKEFAPDSFVFEIKYYHEGFAEFVSRYLTGEFVDVPRFTSLNTERKIFLTYEKGFEEIKEWFVNLGWNPKRLLEAVTRKILNSL